MKDTGDKKNKAIRDIEKNIRTPEELWNDDGISLPEESLAVNPDRVPKEQLVEREEPFSVGPDKIVRIRFRGAVKYYTGTTDQLIYQISMWRQNPTRAYQSRFGIIQGDQDGEYDKQRWQLVAGTKPVIAKENDLQKAVDAMKELIQRDCIPIMKGIIKQQIQEYVMNVKNGTPGPPPFFIEKEKKIITGGGFFNKIKRDLT